MNELRIAPRLALPLAVVGEVTTIIAKRGAGKTNAGKVLAEEVLDTGLVQVVVLDPIGVWWALRAGADGKPRGGYDLAVFGGMHGDLPLEATAGKLLAETVVDSGQSMVLDVSDLDSDGAMQKFVLDFAERLYRLKQAIPTALLLILEESDEFAPQDTRGANVPRMVGAINRIAKRGRGRGIGLVPITQRSAALNKNVLDQSDTLVILRTTGPRDRKAIKDWTEAQKAEGFSEIAPALPGLQTGEAFVWTPERGLLARVQLRKARTFDSGKTPEPGEVLVEAEVRPIDLQALGEKMQATVERVKENDPALLRRRIAELQRELATRPSEQTMVEVSVFTEEDWQRLSSILTTTATEGKRLVEGAATALASVAAKLETARPAQGERREEAPQRPPTGPSVASRPPARPPAPTADVVSGNGHLDTGARRLLETLGRHYPLRLPPGQLAILAGRKARGGAWNTAMRQLRDGGYLVDEAGLLALTARGVEESGADELVPLSPEEVIEQWKRSLPTGPRGLFELLTSVYPEELSPEDAAGRLGRQPRGGAWNTSVSTLVRNGLAEKRGGLLRAASDLCEVPA